MSILRYTITCQFGNAVITVDQNSNPSSYDQIYPNFRLDEGSVNNYPFDVYAADATAWCYFDATVANSRVIENNFLIRRHIKMNRLLYR